MKSEASGWLWCMLSHGPLFGGHHLCIALGPRPGRCIMWPPDQSENVMQRWPARPGPKADTCLACRVCRPSVRQTKAIQPARKLMAHAMLRACPALPCPAGGVVEGPTHPFQGVSCGLLAGRVRGSPTGFPSFLSVVEQCKWKDTWSEAKRYIVSHISIRTHHHHPCTIFISGLIVYYSLFPTYFMA